MRKDWMTPVSLGALVVLTVVVILAGAQLVELKTNVIRLAEHSLNNITPEQHTMATLTTTWTSQVGEHVATTTRGEEETAAEHAARHAADVEAAQAQFPKI